MIRHVAITLMVVLGVALHSLPASAATPVSCSVQVDNYLVAGNGVNSLLTVGVRVAAYGVSGFSSFTMRDTYQVETDPLHTPGAAAQSTFWAYKSVPADNFSGHFSEVFPGRGNGDEDHWDFWVNRGGLFYLRSVTWGGSWALLQSPVCYAGPDRQFVVTGYIDNPPGFGTDFWTFVMSPDDLI
jgi:hypothetical protein